MRLAILRAHTVLRGAKSATHSTDKSLDTDDEIFQTARKAPVIEVKTEVKTQENIESSNAQTIENKTNIIRRKNNVLTNKSSHTDNNNAYKSKKTD